MSHFDISKTYQTLMTKLKAGERGLIRFTNLDIKSLSLQIETWDLTAPQEEFYQLLCILGHAAKAELQWHPWLIQCLKHSPNYPALHVIALLNAVDKHCIQGAQIQGHKISPEVLHGLRPLLSHPSPEVLEWVLRIIENCGAQGMIFVKELDRLKPPFWKMFFQTQRNIRELIELLERRWKRYGQR